MAVGVQIGVIRAQRPWLPGVRRCRIVIW